MTTTEIVKLLRSKYAPPAHAIIFEVGNGTGGNCNRHADALAMGIWPSRGMELEGFEIKASRNDWLKELKNPAKAESIFQFCDRWWLVAGDKSIVATGELPSTWGLMVPGKSGLSAIVAAPALSPKPMSRSFLAAIMRRVVEQSVDAATLAAKREEGFQAGKAHEAELYKYDKKRLEELEEKVKSFEEASGVNIRYGWDHPKKIGEAVKRVLKNETPVCNIRQMLGWVEQVQKSGQRLLDELEASKEDIWGKENA